MMKTNVRTKRLFVNLSTIYGRSPNLLPSSEFAIDIEMKALLLEAIDYLFFLLFSLRFM